MENVKFVRTEIVKIGDPVLFMDESREKRHALVTAVHGMALCEEGGELVQAPCVNIIVCSKDPSKQDVYGRQFERHCSVQHRSSNSYHEETTGQPIGMTWELPSEYES